MENADKSSSDSSSELSDDEYAEKLKEINDLRTKMEGKKAKESTMKDEEEKNEDDDEYDEEIEGLAADFTLYYSPLDRVHELYYVKKKLEELAKRDMTLYKQLTQALSKEESEGFSAAMVEADRLQKDIDDDFNEA